jgi:hypothetical protein
MVRPLDDIWAAATATATAIINELYYLLTAEGADHAERVSTAWWLRHWATYELGDEHGGSAISWLQQGSPHTFRYLQAFLRDRAIRGEGVLPLLAPHAPAILRGDHPDWRGKVARTRAHWERLVIVAAVHETARVHRLYATRADASYDGRSISACAVVAPRVNLSESHIVDNVWTKHRDKAGALPAARETLELLRTQS